jgi:hypothetical protein
MVRAFSYFTSNRSGSHPGRTDEGKHGMKSHLQVILWRENETMRIITAGLLLLTSAALSFGSDAQLNDWGNLSRLRAGERIEVIRMNMKNVKGEFQSSSGEALVVRSEGTDTSIPRADVMRISTREKSKRLRNVLIGMAIGGAAGLAVGAATDASFSEDDEHIAKTVFTPIGLGAGAALGAAFAGFETIYRAPKK